jgi:CheY-like chemotaxis protein
VTPVILVVDDEPIIAATVAMLLADEGYEVHTAEHGRAALELLNGTRVDLVLSDVRMPVMDGYALLAALRKQGNRAPVVLMTAIDGVAPPPRILKKPFDLDELLRLVAEAVGSPPAEQGP